MLEMCFRRSSGSFFLCRWGTTWCWVSLLALPQQQHLQFFGNMRRLENSEPSRASPYSLRRVFSATSVTNCRVSGRPSTGRT